MTSSGLYAGSVNKSSSKLTNATTNSDFSLNNDKNSDSKIDSVTTLISKNLDKYQVPQSLKNRFIRTHLINTFEPILKFDLSSNKMYNKSPITRNNELELIKIGEVLNNVAGQYGLELSLNENMQILETAIWDESQMVNDVKVNERPPYTNNCHLVADDYFTRKDYSKSKTDPYVLRAGSIYFQICKANKSNPKFTKTKKLSKTK